MKDKRIQPIHVAPSPGNSIDLGQFDLVVSFDKVTLNCRGTAEIKLRPDLRVVITACLKRSADIRFFRLNTVHCVTCRIAGTSQAYNANVLRWSSSIAASQRERAEVTLLPNPQQLTICSNRRTRLKSVVLQLLNFPKVRCTGSGSKDSRVNGVASDAVRPNRLVLNSDSWQVAIEELTKIDDLQKQLTEEGGYGLTHIGKLARLNSQSFSVSDAESALTELTTFLSFASGLSAPVVLPVGFDGAGNRVFEDWSVRPSTPWQSRISWFCVQHGQTLGELYAGFTELLRDTHLGPSVRKALYWYQMSNRAGKGPGVDGGVVLGQAALELLSTAYLSSEGLSLKGNVAERLRRTFGELGLPVSIPRSVRSAYAAKRRGVWVDVPDAVTKLRNDLVHPLPKLHDHGKYIADVWTLAQWSIELFVLRLSNYSGLYSNRVRARSVDEDEVEYVPWSK